MKAVLYVHGMGGNAAECRRFEPIFPDCSVFGSDYRTSVPWEAGKEIRSEAVGLKKRYDLILLVANSIGAFFCLHADIGRIIEKAFFISPIVDMEGLISGMMTRENVTEKELKEKGVIRTSTGEEISWEYLIYVKSHPVRWKVPTHILCGGADRLAPPEKAAVFAEEHGASLTVMKNGEHWFHTEEQLRFLDDWIGKYR